MIIGECFNMGNTKRLSRMALILNGAQRFVLYEKEKDSLAVVLRRMGLTGTKIGCGSGVCGACTVCSTKGHPFLRR
jgi:aerobic-type carbon monoxide dehydrogenase small subunit (CoxS/CutS family)